MRAADIETSSDTYALRFNGAAGTWFLDVQAAAVLGLLRSYRGARVLEVGGGHAQLAGRLSEAGFRVTVQGSAPECAARVRRLDSGIPFVCSAMERLPFPEDAFDVVASIRTLAHVPDPARLLRECARVASRAVLVDFPSRRSLNILSGMLYGLKRSVEKSTRPYRLLPPSLPARILRAEGFHRARSVPQFFWPMVLHRVHGSRRLGRLIEAPFRVVGLTRLFGSPHVTLYER